MALYDDLDEVAQPVAATPVQAGKYDDLDAPIPAAGPERGLTPLKITPLSEMGPGLSGAIQPEVEMTNIPRANIPVPPRSLYEAPVLTNPSSPTPDTMYRAEVAKMAEELSGSRFNQFAQPVRRGWAGKIVNAAVQRIAPDSEAARLLRLDQEAADSGMMKSEDATARALSIGGGLTSMGPVFQAGINPILLLGGMEAVGQAADLTAGVQDAIRPESLASSLAMGGILKYGVKPEFARQLMLKGGGPVEHLGRGLIPTTIKAAEATGIDPVIQGVVALNTGDFSRFRESLDSAPKSFAETLATFAFLELKPLATAGMAGEIDAKLRTYGLKPEDARKLANTIAYNPEGNPVLDADLLKKVKAAFSEKDMASLADAYRTKFYHEAQQPTVETPNSTKGTATPTEQPVLEGKTVSLRPQAEPVAADGTVKPPVGREFVAPEASKPVQESPVANGSPTPSEASLTPTQPQAVPTEGQKGENVAGQGETRKVDMSPAMVADAIRRGENVEPPIPEGMVRLYRAEPSGETEKTATRSDTGKFWSPDRAVTVEYGDRVYYVDVPRDSVDPKTDVVLANAMPGDVGAKLLEPGYYDVGDDVYSLIDSGKYDEAADLYLKNKTKEPKPSTEPAERPILSFSEFKDQYSDAFYNEDNDKIAQLSDRYPEWAKTIAKKLKKSSTAEAPSPATAPQGAAGETVEPAAKQPEQKAPVSEAAPISTPRVEENQRFVKELVDAGIPEAAAKKGSVALHDALQTPAAAKKILHPNNKNFRRIWQRETGKSLHKTVTGTNMDIDTYFRGKTEAPAPKKGAVVDVIESPGVWMDHQDFKNGDRVEVNHPILGIVRGKLGMRPGEKVVVDSVVLTYSEAKKYGMKKIESTPVEKPSTQVEAKKLTFDEFKKQYITAFKESMKYKPGEIGSRKFTDEMARLSDLYPEWANQVEESPDVPDLSVDLTVTGQDKPVPGRPGAGYVVHHRKPDMLPDKFRVIMSRIENGFLSVAGTGMTARDAYDNALAQYDRAMAERNANKRAPQPAEPSAKDLASVSEDDFDKMFDEEAAKQSLESQSKSGSIGEEYGQGTISIHEGAKSGGTGVSTSGGKKAPSAAQLKARRDFAEARKPVDTELADFKDRYRHLKRPPKNSSEYGELTNVEHGGVPTRVWRNDPTLSSWDEAIDYAVAHGLITPERAHDPKALAELYHRPIKTVGQLKAGEDAYWKARETEHHYKIMLADLMDGRRPPQEIIDQFPKEYDEALKEANVTDEIMLTPTEELPVENIETEIHSEETSPQENLRTPGELFPEAEMPFNLAGETAEDFERTAKEKAASEARSKEAEKKQKEFGEEPPPKTDKEHAKEAGQHAKEAAKNWMDGLNELFGKGTHMGATGPTFSEETYQKAKPFFRKGLDEAIAAGKSLRDFIASCIKKWGADIKPYLKRFMNEVAAESKGAGAISDPNLRTANRIADIIKSDRKLERTEADKIMSEEVGGTQAQGNYSVKDLNDAIELAVNIVIRDAKAGTWPFYAVNVKAGDAIETVRALKALVDRLPTQTNRTMEMDKLQQFSTPPALAYMVNWAANIQPGETVIEPSAGIGGIAVFAHTSGAKVIVNELDPRRAAVLKALDIADVSLTENAEHLNALLTPRINKDEFSRPTAVVMNPPFSHGANTSTASTFIGAKHVESALELLEDGGRLVAIVGEGMAADKPRFRLWWDKIRQTYNVRANISISGNEYRKYGTTFGNQILVIDKTGPTPKGATVIGSVEKIEDLVPLLEGIRDERYGTTELAPAESGGKKPTTQGGGSSQPGADVHTPTGGIRLGSIKAGKPSGTGRPAKGAGAGLHVEPATPKVRPQGPGAGVKSGRGDKQAVAGSGGVGNVALEGPAAGIPVGIREKQPKTVSEDGVFSDYAPSKVLIEGSQPHPTPLIESTAMASVELPDPTYSPKLPKSLITSGALSDAQLEPIVYAGQAHSQMLPEDHGVTSRLGYFTGDGTGVGKGRIISGVMLDNINNGRKKAIWVSKTGNLINDAKRDLGDTGVSPDVVIDLWKGTGKNLDPKEDGIAFVTYKGLALGNPGLDADNKLRPVDNPAKASRIASLYKWLGPDFDGVIVFDEVHLAGNAIDIQGARGVKRASQQGMAVVDLQTLFPKARILYSSATGATEITNLSYGDRLGIWGHGTPFTNKQAFFNQITSGGMSALEIVARDLKAMGRYLARTLSMKGTESEQLIHKLTPDQKDIYNNASRAWQLVFQNVDTTMARTGANNNGRARSAALSALYGAQQRFYNQLLTALQMPTVITDVKKQLAEGNSILFQFVNTNAATQDRAIANATTDDDAVDLDNMDLSPRDVLLEFVNNSYPTQLYEPVTDQNGNTRWVPVVDATGAPVQDPEAVREKGRLMDRLALLQMPQNPLEMILDTFGVDNVAEVTGRTQRIVQRPDDDGVMKRVLERRTESHRLVETKEYQEGKRRILAFSDAGGTGFTYNSSKKFKNQQRRIHYLLQAGWRADSAIQGLGRSHRSNQANAPFYKPVSTDIKGHQRFISSIVRRLAQVGSLVSGERKAAASGLFSESSNLESVYAEDAVTRLIYDIYNGHVEGWSLDRLSRDMGFGKTVIDDHTGSKKWVNTLIDPDTGAINDDAVPSVQRFLNRILSLEVEPQDQLFDLFTERLERRIENAKNDGTFDPGLQTLKALEIRKVSDEVVYEHPGTAAKTRIVEVEADHAVHFNSWDDITKTYATDKKVEVYAKNKQSGKVYAFKEGPALTQSSGSLQQRYRRIGPSHVDLVAKNDVRTEDTTFDAANYDAVSEKEAKVLWADELATSPKLKTTKENYVVGTFLPIWDRIGIERPKIWRITTKDGETFLGAHIPPKKLASVRRRMNAGRGKTRSAADIITAILDNDETIELANGWSLERSRVSGEYRIEVRNVGFGEMDEFTDTIGGFTEKIQFRPRFFVPTGPKAITVMENILKKSPVVEADDSGSASGSLGFTPTASAGLPPVVRSSASASGLPVSPAGITGRQVKTPKALMSALQDAMNKKIVAGRMSGRNRRGEYHPSTTATVIRDANDIVVAGHEVAHGLDDAYQIVKSWMGRRVKSPFDNELSVFWGDSPAMKRKLLSVRRQEGVANWFASWLINPDQAQAMAPNFWAYVQTKVPAEVLKDLGEVSKDIRAFVAAAEEGKVSNVEWEPKPFKSEQHGDFGITFKDKIIRQWRNDKWIADKAFLHTLDKLGLNRDTDITPDKDFIRLRHLFSGAFARARSFIEYGFRDANLKPITDNGNAVNLEWMMDVPDSMKPEKGLTVADIERESRDAMDYAIAERTIEKAKQAKRDINISGLGAGIFTDTQMARNIMNRIEADPVHNQRIRERVRRYRVFADAILQYMVAKGRISKESYKAIKDSNEFYVAMQRVIELAPGEELVTFSRGLTGKSIGTMSTPSSLKNFRGHSATIKNPYISLLDTVFSVVAETARNDAKLAFLDPIRQLRKMYEGTPEDLSEIARPVPSAENKNTVVVWNDGVKEHWQLDDDVYKAMKGLEDGAVILPWPFTLGAKLVRTGTVYFPAFMMRQRIRDPQHLVMVSDESPMKLLGESLKLTVKKQEKGELLAAGAGMAGYFDEGIFTGLIRQMSEGKRGRYLERRYYQMMRQAMEEASGDKTALIFDPRNWWEAYRSFAENQSDIKTRLALYKAAKARAMKEKGYTEAQASIYAASEARDVIGDYVEAGTFVRWLTQVIPFVNPGFQFGRAQYQAAKKHPAKWLLKYGLTSLMVTLAVRLFNLWRDDDDEARSQPAYLRDMFWNIKIAPNFWLRIPRDYTTGVMSAVMDRMIDMALYGESASKAFEGYGDSFAKAIIPVDENAILSLNAGAGTLGQAAMNYDMFQGRPIVSKYEENLALDKRTGTKYASRFGQAAQATGQAVESVLPGKYAVDARKIDFIMRSLFGLSGSLVTKASDIGREDKAGLTVGSLVGLSAQSPAIGDPDVQWVQEQAAQNKWFNKNDYKALRDIKDEYYSVKTDEERDRLAEEMRDKADAIRKDWEPQIKETRGLQPSPAVKLDKYGLPKAAKTDKWGLSKPSFKVDKWGLPVNKHLDKFGLQK